ncbi:four helix bundle protein [bacterium]|nr:four helix bundle protein [bacterium]
MDKRVRNVRELEVYKISFEAAMKIFEISKKFPKDERYSLVSQIRRSSRSVCSNLAEGWRKRRYSAVFINKLSDSSQEATETQTWLEFALACKYIDLKFYEEMQDIYEHICAMLINMGKKVETFCK